MLLAQVKTAGVACYASSRRQTFFVLYYRIDQEGSTNHFAFLPTTYLLSLGL